MQYHSENGTPVHRSRRTGRTHPRLTRLVARAIREADAPHSIPRPAAYPHTADRDATRILILAESGSPRHRRFVHNVVAHRHGV